MSLILCPECGTELSDAAVACPNCGKPLHSIPVVREAVPIRREESGTPKWVIIPVAIVIGLVLVLAFVLLYRSGTDDSNVNLKVNASRPTTTRDVARTDTVVESAPGSVSTVPGSSTSVNPPVNPPSTSTVPGTTTDVAPPTKGSVTVDAKIQNRNGNGTAPVRNARFYLLDKDVEAILSEARVEPIEGQNMMSSLGLAASFPSRFADFQRQAMAAIKTHVKAAATTNGSGKADFSGVEPNVYYLFAVTNTPQGFALWSSPVTIAPGANVLNLEPQPLTDVSSFSE